MPTTITSPTRIFARLTGLAYLVLAVLGGFAFFAVSEQLNVPGDAAATAANIIEQEGLFRLGLGAYWAILLLDVLIAWMLFRLFQPHNESIARLSAWLRLGYVFAHAAAILELNGVLDILNGALTAQTSPLRADMIQHHMAAHLDGFLVSLIIFGAHLLVMGGLIIATRAIPRLIGALLILSGSAYILDGFAFILLKDYAAFHAATQTGIAIIAVIGEMSFLFWLLIRGVNYSGVGETVGGSRTS